MVEEWSKDGNWPRRMSFFRHLDLWKGTDPLRWVYFTRRHQHLFKNLDENKS